MAVMMKVCGLFERNADGGNAYRYLTGFLNEQTRVVIMPNREKRSDGDPDWILYLAPLPSGSPSAPEAAPE